MPSKRKITLIVSVVGLLVVSWLCYSIFFSRTNTTIVETVSGLELVGSYDIQVIEDSWADPTSTSSDGKTFLKVNLTEEQCSALVNQARQLNYQNFPIILTGTTELPNEITNINDGMYRINIGVPDNRDVKVSAIDVGNKKLYVFFNYM